MTHQPYWFLNFLQGVPFTTPETQCCTESAWRITYISATAIGHLHCIWSPSLMANNGLAEMTDAWMRRRLRNGTTFYSTKTLRSKANCPVFSTLDLAKAYHWIPVAFDDISKTVVWTFFRLFEFTWTIFGLYGAVQTFWRFIFSVLRNFDFCFTYLDDVLVASFTESICHISTAFFNDSLTIV